MSTRKLVARLGTGVAAAAFTVAVVQADWAQRAEAASAAAERQSHALQTELTKVNARLAQAERRATDAEKDSGDLLKAVESLRAPPARPEAGMFRVAQNAGPPSRSPEEEARLARERAFQQELAKRRVEEAKARAKIDSDAAAIKDPVERYHKLMAAAEQYASTADFQAGIRTYNLAMQMKPADLPVTDQIRQLQGTLKAQNTPVELSLISDGLTLVSVTGPYGHRPPAPLETDTVKVFPANYEIIGQRKGFKDVVIPVQVRNGVPAPVISVTCTVPVAP